MKTFAVRYECDGYLDMDELYLNSPDVKEATDYCTEWASWTKGLKVHSIREVVGKEQQPFIN